MKVQAPALVSKVATMADGSIRMTIDTPELPAEEMATLFGLRNGQGWFLFSENTLTDVDVPAEQAEVGSGKTPSQRLRAVLYVLWEQQGRKGDFEHYYRIAMEREINKVKDRIDG